MAKRNYNTLRLILGDQLNLNHCWYQTQEKDVVYFMAEMRQETDYTRHHIQKVVAFFASMRNMAKQLKDGGHNVIYYTLDDENNTQSLTDNLQQIIEQHGITNFEYQLPDEYRLDSQLQTFCNNLQIESSTIDTEHFLTTREYLEEFFAGKKQYVMEYFYRQMRKKYDLMMDDIGEPLGGQWNFDKSNRKKWNTKDAIPPIHTHNKDVTKLVSLIENHGVTTIGNIDASNFHWPTNYAEAKSTRSRKNSNRLLAEQ